MKRVEAVIRKTKFSDVQAALNEVGIEFFSFWEVRGVGKSRQERAYRGIVYDTGVIERIMIVYYCREKYLKPGIDALLKAARTGEIGDGKIFVSNIDNAIRIRTGQEGDEALFVEGEENIGLE